MHDVSKTTVWENGFAKKPTTKAGKEVLHFQLESSSVGEFIFVLNPFRDNFVFGGFYSKIVLSMFRESFCFSRCFINVWDVVLLRRILC